MPISRGDYLHKDQAKEHFCVNLVYRFIMCLCPSLPIQYISYVHGTIQPICAESAVTTNQP